MPLARNGDLVLDYVEESDCDSAGELYLKSWHVYPFFQNMMPDGPNTREGWAHATKFAVNDPNTICLKVTDTNTGKIVAQGRWVRPKKQDDTVQPALEEDRWGNAFLEACDEKLAGELFTAIEEGREKYMGQSPHWYMELLFTDAKYHRKGCGTMLLEHGLELADRDQLPCFINAYPMGKSLYKKLGWELHHAKDFEYGFAQYSGVRQPQKA